MPNPTRLILTAVPDIPLVRPGDDLARLLADRLTAAALSPQDGDVLVLAQKIVSKAEGRLVPLATVTPSPRAVALAAEVGKDPRLVEIILSESVRVVRHRPNLLIMEHRLGFVMANAGVDHSNLAAPGAPEQVLLLPENPDASAAALRTALMARFGVSLAVVITDSFGRAWRRGSAGIAIGAAGLPALVDLRGTPDLFGRTLEVTLVGLADEIAAERLPAPGPGAGGPARRAAARPHLVRPGRARRRPGPPAGGGSVPVIVALSGGIGGAKLALGLAHVTDPASLLIVANTGDDFEHLGLAISPDIDTLLYTLAGLDNPALGWGRGDETWACMETLETLGGETWFRLGDRDLALHLARTARLRAGAPLSAVTDDLRRRLGIGARILPASDDPVRTRLDTDQGVLEFQEYFVHQRCAPAVRAITFAGAAAARPLDAVTAAIAAAEAVVICPSNPFISIDPILAVPGLRAALERTDAPVVAVSPIIGGRAVKGPTAKMMAELGLPATARAVAEHYAGLLDVFVADPEDATGLAGIDAKVVAAPTLMRSLADKQALARVVLAAAEGAGR